MAAAFVAMSISLLWGQSALAAGTPPLTLFLFQSPLSTGLTTTLNVSPPEPDGENGWYLSSPGITLDVSGGAGLAATYYAWDATADVSWVTYTPGQVLTVDGGTHILSYRSIDPTPTVESINTQEFKVDLDNPSDPAAVTAEPYGSNQAIVSWEQATDDTSGVVAYGIYDGSQLLVTADAALTSDVASGLSAGAHLLKVRAIDEAGRMGAGFTDTVDITDDVAPAPFTTVGPATPDGNSGWYKSYPEVTVDAVDPSGTASVMYAWADGPTTPDTSAPAPFVSTPDADGATRTLSYLAIDTSGNTSDAESIALMIDTAPPVGPSGITADAVASNGAIVQWSGVTDDLSGTAGYRIYSSNDVMATADAGDTSAAVSGLPAGIQPITVTAIDVAGNESDRSEAVTIDVSDTEPAFNSLIISPSTPSGNNGWYRESTPSITLDAEDPSGPVVVNFNWDGETADSVYSTPLSPAEGEHVLTYYSIDGAGNTSDADTFEVKVDTEAPSAPATFDATVSSTSATLFWAPSTDDTSGLSAYRVYSVSDDVRTLIASPPANAVSLDVQALPSGANSFEILAKDLAGNMSSVTELDVDITDEDAPVLQLTVAAATGSSGWYTEGTSVDLSATDPSGVAALQYQWDQSSDSAWTNYSAPIAIPNGTHRLYYRASDTSGNTSDVSSRQFKLDVSAPKKAWLSTPRLSISSSVNGTFNISWPTTDQGSSGIASYDVRQKITSRGGWNYWKYGTTATKSKFVGAEGTTYCFAARARDRAGNVGVWGTTRCTIVPFDDTNADIKGSSFGWHKTTGSAFQEKTNHYSSAKGAWASFRFYGSEVNWIGGRGPSHGKAALYLDGRYITTVDSYASKTAYRAVLKRYTWSKSGWHTIKIKVLRSKRTAASGYVVDLDGFGVLR